MVDDSMDGELMPSVFIIRLVSLNFLADFLPRLNLKYSKKRDKLDVRKEI